MKQTFVQCADILLEPGADPAAPGGAVTLRLCGSWDHPGPCRYPHRTSAEWDGPRGQLRVVFTAPEEEAAEVRRQIELALAGGACTGPNGQKSHWIATTHGAGTLKEEEKALSETWEAAATSPPPPPSH